MKFEDYIATVTDFPEKGIVFRDITPLMANGEAFRAAIQAIVAFGSEKEVDVIVGPEARGFIVGCPVAYELGIGFVPARKKGKLPRATATVQYGLEYGVDILQVHIDDIKPGQKVMIVDDLLATGGTIQATISLLEGLGAEVVGAAFLIELLELEARQKIAGYDIFSLLQY